MLSKTSVIKRFSEESGNGGGQSRLAMTSRLEPKWLLQPKVAPYCIFVQSASDRPTDRPVSGVCHARCHARMSRSRGSWPPRCSHRLKPEKWGFLDTLSSIFIDIRFTRGGFHMHHLENTLCLSVTFMSRWPPDRDIGVTAGGRPRVTLRGHMVSRAGDLRLPERRSDVLLVEVYFVASLYCLYGV